MYKTLVIKIQLIVLLLGLSACSGMQTFSSRVMAGDTAVVAAGWQKNFSRDNLTVTVIPSIGVPTVYLPGDPAVRAVINLYPDPLSSIVVSEQTDLDLTPFARTYASSVNFATGGDKDWWQTTVFVDLPAIMPIGIATIEVSNAAGDFASSTVEIIAGQGLPEEFNAELNGPLTAVQLASMERVGHYVVSFTGSVMPYAVQVDFSHDPDNLSGGIGKAHVSNPKGDLKSVIWNDDGSNLTVMLTPSKAQLLADLIDFKFYVAGGITGLVVSNVKAIDSNGVPVNGISAVVTTH